ncbi:MAG: energy-coupling factor transporter ATPase [Clostridia bacterium]|nr:energy-coupling factor transporter ATPase [Clostridia bacterium]
MQIKVENLRYTYSPKTPFEKVALDDISFVINEGDTIGIIGSTGSGKSTLCQHFNALIRISHGKIFVGEMELHSKKLDLGTLRKTVGMLFQYPEYQLFADTVKDDVEFGPLNFGMSKEDASILSKYALELTGLDYEEVKDKSPFELSGGQKRRAAIAGVIASRPEILVLDEPTAGLDPQGKREILDLVKKLKESYVKTVIMISHNMDEIAEYCNRVIVLNESKLLYDTTPRELFSHPEKLQETGLEVPHVVALALSLKEKGIDLGETPLTKKEFVDLLTRRLPCVK